MRLTRYQLALSLTLGILAAGSLVAQDPPSRVARLNFLRGEVSFQPPSVDDWSPASLNYPLSTGSHIYTADSGTAEMRIGSNSIFLGNRTNFEFLNLDDRTVQVSFNSGTVSVRLRRMSGDDVYEIDTPNGAVTLLRNGDYRIDSDPERNGMMVTVRNGEAEVTSGSEAVPVHSRQTAYFDGSGQPDIRSANEFDSFDQFTRNRARVEDVPPPSYVSPDMVGYEDLNAYGSWRSNSEYGNVWIPRVDAGWAPYHQGRWAWVDPWGWTWIDEAPWGFAPFHYGRWASIDGSWGWCPGPANIRPIYAPALVAFVGGGSGFGLSVGFGGGGAVGWFALGPRETYRPSYHVSDNYVRQVNVTNITNYNITNINVNNQRYVNQNVSGAAVAMSQRDFAGSRQVQRAAIPIQAAQFRQMQVINNAPVVPQRSSVLAVANMNGSVVRPPAQLVTRQVIARTEPPAPVVSFQARQQALQQAGGRPVDPATLQTLRQQPSALVQRVAVRPVSQAAAQPQGVRPGVVPNNNFPQRAPMANQPQTAPVPNNNFPQRAPAVSRPQDARPANPQQPNNVQPNYPVRPQPNMQQPPTSPNNVQPTYPVRPQPNVQQPPTSPNIQPNYPVRPQPNVQQPPNSNYPVRPSQPNAPQNYPVRPPTRPENVPVPQAPPQVRPARVPDPTQAQPAQPSRPQQQQPPMVYRPQPQAPRPAPEARPQAQRPETRPARPESTKEETDKQK